jgi:hypothetical protein
MWERAAHHRSALAGITGVGMLIAGVALANPFGHFGIQRWSGQWSFIQSKSGLMGGFGFRHETDSRGRALLRQIGGRACREPTDYFAGGYAIPETSALGPGEKYIDTGKIRGCTVANPDRLVGRYQSDGSISNSGNIDLVLASGRPSGDRPYAEHWTGTFTEQGVRGKLEWQGDFEGPFTGDGAFDPSNPPYRRLAVSLYGKFFNPPNATVATDAVVTICNHDPFLHDPASLSRYNKFTGRHLFTNQCRTVTARNPTNRPIAFRIYDEIHSQERLTLDVIPVGRRG